MGCTWYGCILCRTHQETLQTVYIIYPRNQLLSNHPNWITVTCKGFWQWKELQCQYRTSSKCYNKQKKFKSPIHLQKLHQNSLRLQAYIFITITTGTIIQPIQNAPIITSNSYNPTKTLTPHSKPFTHMQTTKQNKPIKPIVNWLKFHHQPASCHYLILNPHQTHIPGEVNAFKWQISFHSWWLHFYCTRILPTIQSLYTTKTANIFTMLILVSTDNTKLLWSNSGVVHTTINLKNWSITMSQNKFQESFSAGKQDGLCKYETNSNKQMHDFSCLRNILQN